LLGRRRWAVSSAGGNISAFGPEASGFEAHPTLSSHNDAARAVLDTQHHMHLGSLSETAAPTTGDTQRGLALDARPGHFIGARKNGRLV
jgi:hypothetical protein